MITTEFNNSNRLFWNSKLTGFGESDTTVGEQAIDYNNYAKVLPLANTLSYLAYQIYGQQGSVCQSIIAGTAALHFLYIGKIGIVKEAHLETISVTFFIWTNTGEGNSVQQGDTKILETGRHTLVEVTYAWHPKTVREAFNIHLLDADRAILIKNKDLTKATMVSIRVVDAETLSLRLPHSEPFNWKQSENSNDIILPIYTGRHLACLMRDRNPPAPLPDADRLSSRAVFGVSPTEISPDDVIEALRSWLDTGDHHQFQLMLHRNPKLKNANIDGRTSLMIAVELGVWPAVATLLCLGAEYQMIDSEGNGLYHIAAIKGHERVIEGLMIFNAGNINHRNFKGGTPLHAAISSGSVSCIDRLLNSPNVQPNIQDSCGNTPLHLVAALEEIPTRSAMLHRMLSSIKIDQMLVNKDGLTALQIAIIGNQAKVVESFITMKPSLLVSNGSDALLPLHLAAAYGHSAVLNVIIKHFSDINKTTKANRTALHFAIERWNGNVDEDMQRLACIQTLVSLGVPLNTRDCDGMTALHIAARATQGHSAIPSNKMHAVLQLKKPNVPLEELASAIRPHWPIAVICFLISQGSDPHVRDRSGRTASDMVTDSNLKTLIEQFSMCRPRLVEYILQPPLIIGADFNSVKKALRIAERVA